MLPSFAVIIWASSAFASCTVKSRVVHYRPSENRQDSYFPPQSQSQARTSSLFSSAGQPPSFPYRFVFPANHPALSGPTFSQYVNTPHSSYNTDLGYSEEIFGNPQAEHHKHRQLQHSYEAVGGKQQQQQQQQQFNDIFNKHAQQQQQHPFGYIKQSKFPSFDSMTNAVHQTFPSASTGYQQAATAASFSQPIMLLIPSSGQPGAPYQTLVLVPSAGPPSPPPPPSIYPGNYQQFQQSTLQPQQQLSPQLAGGFVTNPRGPPLVATGFSSFQTFPSAKFPSAQLFHRSHDSQPHQQQHQPPPPSPPLQYQQPPKPSYQGPVPHGSLQQHAIEDKVSAASGTSSESASGELVDDDKNVAEPKRDSQQNVPEYGEKTTSKVPKRIVVT